MDYFYIAVEIKENGKFYAYVLKVSAGNNLVSALNIPGVVHANICPTRKRAREIVNYWNFMAMQNGNYLFDDGPLF